MGHGDDHSHPSAMVWNKWSYRSTSPAGLHSVRRDSITLLIAIQEYYNCTFKPQCLNIPVATYYSGIKIFNDLPKAIKDISSKPQKFKIALKHHLLTYSFYSLDKFTSKQLYLNLTVFI